MRGKATRNGTRTRPRGDARPSARRWWRKAISLTPGGEFLYRLGARKGHENRIGHKVKAGSSESAQIVEEAIKAMKKNNRLLGIGMHAYQDSWSHEGLCPIEGHARKGSSPDWPYTDGGKKAMKMAEAVYKKMEEYRSKHF